MRYHVGRRVAKGPSLVGQEEVPGVFGLRTRDLGGNTADAGNSGRPAQLSIDYWEEPRF